MVFYYILIASFSFLFAFLGTPVARALAIRLNILDHPSVKKLHFEPIPMLGGVAISFAFLTVILGVCKLPLNIWAAWILCAIGILGLGLWDDIFHLPATYKLLGQIGISIVAIICGVKMDIFPNEVANLFFTLLWLVGITNAFNLLDNIDGLSVGVAAISATIIAILAALENQYLVGSIACALAGSCLGFLRYNFNPASIFMGDTGSMFLGFTLAVLSLKLQFSQSIPYLSWSIPIVILGLPILDTTMVFFSRLRENKNPLLHGGKDHLSHRLLTLGMNDREAVMYLYLIAIIYGIGALFLTRASFELAIMILAGALFLSLFIWVKLWGRKGL